MSPRQGVKGENTPFTKQCRQKECYLHGTKTGSRQEHTARTWTPFQRPLCFLLGTMCGAFSNEK